MALSASFVPKTSANIAILADIGKFKQFSAGEDARCSQDRRCKARCAGSFWFILAHYLDKGVLHALSSCIEIMKEKC